MSGMPDAVARLVDKFDLHRGEYLAAGYREEELRSEFIDPFFSALGWDVANVSNKGEAYKDLVRESLMKAGAPDYCFRVGGAPKFYVEAKKPSIDLLGQTRPAFQLRSYAWTAKLPLGILTDFEELAVYDCRVKPKEKDAARVARRDYLTYREYAGRWDWIASVFSKEAVEQGRFDSYAGSEKGRGVATVDDEFLKDIEAWRDTLAHNIANRNGRLGDEELNAAVQSTIDRILFLRMAEDRGIEPFGRLQALANGTEIHARLRQLYRDADNRYNSGLFHFAAEKDRPTPPDTLTPRLEIDDKVLKDILASLYYPSPYQFSVMPPDILGNVYEQFLGKVIRVTPGGQARVEEKPEVKKAGGVYYTPKYIVDYIVAQTVEKIVAGKTPKQAAKLRVLDPACGSGSFLVGAYRKLLDWHREWYVAHGPEKHPKEIVRGPDGWLLTTAVKKRILLKNIFGVDIDRQAVEVTKLNLLLCVLENENRTNLDALLFQHERALPDLDSNIKCGNSLIGPDYFTGRLIPDEDEMRRVNPFDWKAEFPQVFPSPSGRGQGEGGFDAVIGNPPYIRIQTMKEWAPLEVEIYKELYASAASGNYDIYVVFVEKGLSLLRKGGRLGFILPHKFFNAQYGLGLRTIISKGKHLSHVVHFGDQQVFDGATTYTCLMFLDKAGREACDFVKIENLDAWRMNGDSVGRTLEATQVTAAEWNYAVGKATGLLEKLAVMPVKLGDIASSIFQGLVTSADPVYLLEPVSKPADGFIRVRSAATQKEYQLETGVVWPLCKGSLDIRRYLASPSKAVLFPYDFGVSEATGKTVLIPPAEFKRSYPKAWSYLIELEGQLRNREKGKMRHAGWYGYVYPKSITRFAKRKLLTPSIAARASFAFDKEGEMYFVGSGGGGGGGYGIILSDDAILSLSLGYEYVLGLLNSRLLDTYLRSISGSFRGGYFAYSRQFIERLPIRPINFADPADKSRHDRMVKLVDAMLELHKRLAKAKGDHDRELVQRQIDATDREIDKLVYELYGLTAEEIAIVEGTATK